VVSFHGWSQIRPGRTQIHRSYLPIFDPATCPAIREQRTLTHPSPHLPFYRLLFLPLPPFFLFLLFCFRPLHLDKYLRCISRIQISESLSSSNDIGHFIIIIILLGTRPRDLLQLHVMSSVDFLNFSSS
jgi:hypothetical protein